MDNNEIDKKVEEIIKLINLIPGDKIIEIACIRPNRYDTLTATVSSDGVLGFEDFYPSPSLFKAIYLGHLAVEKISNKNNSQQWNTLKNILKETMTNTGGLTIRQFLNIKVERIIKNQKKLWIPQKKIYGIGLNKGSWIPLSKEEIEEACTTDAKTGKYLSYEPDVIYSDLSEFMNKLSSENNNVKAR